VKKVLILGAGFGGLETATGLADVLGGGYEITLVDKNESFSVGFAKIDVLFGRRTEEQVRSRYADLRAANVRFVRADITAIDTDGKTVATSAGSFGWDYLVVALGADLDPDATPGFRDSGAHEFYSMAGAVRLRPVSRWPSPRGRWSSASSARRSNARRRRTRSPTSSTNASSSAASATASP
jgi:sulfide:quinone oxidoreductase